MAADQAFHERLRRIETGRTWVPDGVYVAEKARRPSVFLKAFRTMLSRIFWLIVVWACVWGFSVAQPEIYEEFTRGDFSSVTEALNLDLGPDPVPLLESTTETTATPDV